ncbi:MAG: Hsp20/alpha crystallin family protein [Geminicoccaceae bacterium]
MTDQPTTAEPTGSAPANAEPVSEAPSFVPPADILETKDKLLVLLDMPDADPDSLNITVDNLVLSISARVTDSSASDGYALLYAEYREGNYERVFTLSGQIDRDRIDAEFKNGVLRLTLPKAATPAKKISVNVV